MLELDNVTYTYPGAPRPALEGVTARLGTGVHLLLGENGAGKTTLLHAMAGLRRPQGGACRIDGVDTALRLPSVASRVFLAGDETEIPARTINEFARQHACFYPSFDPEMLRQNMADFGLDPDAPLSGMSLGTRRKATMAYALALQTDVLLLDEPANGLDINSRKTLRKMMARTLRDDATVVVSTHVVDDLRELYDSVSVLRGSRLLLSAPTSRVMERLDFLTSPVPVPGALYGEPDLGHVRVIAPHQAGRDTEVDFALLYSALLSPSSENIIKALE